MNRNPKTTPNKALQLLRQSNGRFGVSCSQRYTGYQSAHLLKGGQLSLIVRVRHEVADVAVLLSVERTDSTCCSASSILPGRAFQGRRVRSSRHNVTSSARRAAQARALTATASSKA